MLMASTFVIALVALAGFRVVLRIPARIGRKRAGNIITLLEPAVFITADIALIGASIDQFSLAHADSSKVVAPEKREPPIKDACESGL